MKKTAIITSLAVLASAAVLATFALGRGPKLNTFFEAKATSKSFVFDAAAGSQFTSQAVKQTIDVTTGVSSPINTKVAPNDINSLAFGQNGRFVEAHPIAGNYKFPYYSLTIGINNLTHFEIDLGVENDVGGSENKDIYEIVLYDKDGKDAEYWGTHFELDESGNGTAHIEWDKGDYVGTVVKVLVQLEFEKDSADTNFYIESLSLAWEC